MHLAKHERETLTFRYWLHRAGDRCQNSHPLSWRGGGGLCNVTDCDIRQVQPPFHTVGDNYLSVVEGSSITRRRQMLSPATQTGRTVSSDQVQMDALILTVALAYREILSIEHIQRVLTTNEESAKRSYVSRAWKTVIPFFKLPRVIVTRT